MTNLMLHCGANKAEREQVIDTATPEPKDRWHPIPHIKLIEQVEASLTEKNLRVVNQSHALTKDGDRYFGLLEVANCRENNADHAWIVGLRNSHDKAFSAGLAIGAQVFVCDNLSFSGEITIARKHTGNILRDLPGLTTRAIGQLSNRWHTQQQRFDAYKDRELGRAEVNDLVVQAMRSGVIGCTAVPKVLDEYETPRHDEFKDRTAWSLFNGFTEIMKGSESNFALANLPRKTQTLHGILDTFVGIDVASKAEEVQGDAHDAEIVVAE